jgi:hypothetical protein
VPFREPAPSGESDDSGNAPEADLPGEERPEVVRPVEDTEEYAAAAEDDVTLPALAPDPPPPDELSGRPATAEPAKGPE